MNAPPVQLTNVTKWFSDTVALADVSFTLQPGVTGLLGHNGAGKTTALSLISGFSEPSQGTVRISGLNPRDDPGVHRILGLVPDGDGLWPYLTARQIVRFLARQRKVPQPAEATAAALEWVGLTDAADRKVAGFSKGMKQRVRVAQALVHNPSVLLLDEPLNGLDPAQRRHMIEVITTLGNSGRTVLVSSHILTEVERMAQRVLVIVNGRLVAEGSPTGIRDLITEQPRTVRIAGTDLRRLGQLLLADGVVDTVRLHEDELIVETAEAAALARRLPVVAADAAVTLHRIVPEGDDLESVFGYLTQVARGMGR
ncbi:MAG TPA: ABC transporter ATP-binding protein [Mycobacteriales bacterium]|nr:ABC transporter ATP-binding protein [Mycobacteriales bacterium]